MISARPISSRHESPLLLLRHGSTLRVHWLRPRRIPIGGLYPRPNIPLATHNFVAGVVVRADLKHLSALADEVGAELFAAALRSLDRNLFRRNGKVRQRDSIRRIEVSISDRAHDFRLRQLRA